MRDNLYSDDERQYLQMLQGNIERMAANSANCKAWMVTIVAAFMALQCTSIAEVNGWILLGLLPIALFWYLDVFYLHLERGMRNRETDFLNKARRGDDNACHTALYNLKPLMIKAKVLEASEEGNDEIKGMVATDDRWFTESVAPFYGSVAAVVVIISIVVNWSTITEWLCYNQPA